MNHQKSGTSGVSTCFNHLDVREFFQVIRMLRSKQKKRIDGTHWATYFFEILTWSLNFHVCSQHSSINLFHPMVSPWGIPLVSPWLHEAKSWTSWEHFSPLVPVGRGGPWVPEIRSEILAEVDPIDPPPNMMKTHGDPIRRTIDNRKWIYFG